MRYLKLNKLVAKLFAIILSCTAISACIPMPSWNMKQDSARQDTKPKIFAPKGYNTAINAAKAGNYDEAIQLFSDINLTNPDFSNAYTNLGLLHWQKGNKDKARQAFDKALALDPNDAVSYNHLGVMLREQGKFSEAKDMYLNALQHKPDDALACLNLGILYDLYLQDLPNALTQYNTYQKLTGNQDKVVEKWIIDLDKRIQSLTKSQS
jgi:Flp pilus assembly protein TadD